MTGHSASQDQTGRLFDELLVMHVQSGDRRAGERLAARWQPRLLRTANRLLQDEELALVAVQEIWVSITCGMASLRDPARFTPWAFAILRRRSADRIRILQKRRQHEGALENEPGQADPADEKLQIRQAFDALAPDQRLAAQLFFVEGLTLAEIAEVQDVPIGTAKSRLFHARRKLKAALSGETS